MNAETPSVSSHEQSERSERSWWIGLSVSDHRLCRWSLTLDGNVNRESFEVLSDVMSTVNRSTLVFLILNDIVSSSPAGTEPKRSASGLKVKS